MFLSLRAIRQVHRWISIVLSVALLCLAVSAMYYVYVAQVRVVAQAGMPVHKNLDLKQVKISVSEAAQKAGVALEKVQALRLLMIDGAAWYQFVSSGNQAPAYVNASTGETSAQMDEKYAEQIASEQQNTSKVGTPAVVKEFNEEYLPAQKALPVYRFDFPERDNSRLYISTAKGAVMTQTDDLRQSQLFVFNNLHKMQFIQDKSVRNLAIFVLGGFMILVSLTGILLFILTMPRRKNTALPEDSSESNTVSKPESVVANA